jgi:deoxyxylulose-5-phosphate synthase
VRTAFIEQLCALAEQDDRIWLVCGDLGFSVLEVFAQRFPNRYLNAGVAEQHDRNRGRTGAYWKDGIHLLHRELSNYALS